MRTGIYNLFVTGESVSGSASESLIHGIHGNASEEGSKDAKRRRMNEQTAANIVTKSLGYAKGT
jgi:hypothetical protein